MEGPIWSWDPKMATDWGLLSNLVSLSERSLLLTLGGGSCGGWCLVFVSISLILLKQSQGFIVTSDYMKIMLVKLRMCCGLRWHRCGWHSCRITCLPEIHIYGGIVIGYLRENFDKGGGTTLLESPFSSKVQKHKFDRLYLLMVNFHVFLWLRYHHFYSDPQILLFWLKAGCLGW